MGKMMMLMTVIKTAPEERHPDLSACASSCPSVMVLVGEKWHRSSTRLSSSFESKQPNEGDFGPAIPQSL
jgi:hypothetical protein